jgi:hypothetical protein
MMFRMMLGLVVGVVCGLTAEGGTMGSKTRDSAVIQNASVRVELTRKQGRYREAYYARDGRAWRLLLASGHRLRPDPALTVDGTLSVRGHDSLTVHREENGEQVVTLTMTDGAWRVQKVLTLGPDAAMVHVRVAAQVAGRAKLGSLLSTYSFLPDGKRYRDYKPLDFIFTPQLRPEADDVIGDHVFRAPAFMMQQGKRFAALVPDLDLLDVRDRAVKTGADCQVDSLTAPLISYGLLPWTKRAHVYYRHTDSMTVSVRDTGLTYGFFLMLNARAPLRQGFREVVRFHWSRYGHRNFGEQRGPQSEPFSAYIRKAWYEYLPQVALDTLYAEKPVTLLRQQRLAWSNTLPEEADNDCWFNVWFNALRTAYGMWMYGRTAGDRALVSQAERVLTLALSAPQQGGIAPSVFYLDSTGAGHWVADHAWGGIGHGEYLPMFHNAWTNYWLLQWSDLVPGRKDEILGYAGRFAEFLRTQQRKSGVIPSWYHPVTLQPAAELRDENAETAGAALFLAEYSRRTGDARALACAERCMRYVFTAILPQHKWFDFETFFSCSRKPLDFTDPYTLQYPQNTLSMHQAAEACHALNALTGKALYREAGEHILDYLCLYQQVWSPCWLSCELFGGFGVQNTDGEWSDSRQGYFAVTLLKYFDITGRREYLERGIAALRAMFSLFESPTSPRTAENYAHASADQLAGVTGLHWGTGSSVVSIHIITARYGDAYVDLAGEWGAGIDGCRVDTVRIDGDRIDLKIIDAVSSPRNIRVVFANPHRPRYDVTINGQSFGTVSARDMEQGIPLGL